MSKTKIILLGLGVLLVGVVAAVVFTLSNLDSIVKQVVEKAGTHVTQTKVSLADVKIGLTEGTGALSGLRIANPKGFSGNPIFSLGTISVKLDTATLTQDPIVIQEVRIKAPQVLYEIDEKGKSNLDALKKNVAASTEGSGGAPKSSSDSGGTGPKIIIRKLIIEDGQADIKLNALVSKDLSAKLPRIQLNNIGQKSGGATPAEVGQKVITAMTGSLTKVVSSLGVEKLISNALTDKLGGAAGKITEKLKVEGAEDAVKGAGDALKGILGN